MGGWITPGPSCNGEPLLTQLDVPVREE